MTDNVVFWAVAAIVIGFVVMALLPPLLSRPRARDNRKSVAQQIYRAQLAEIDAEVSAGRMTAEQAKAARGDVGRRCWPARPTATARPTSRSKRPHPVDRAGGRSALPGCCRQRRSAST